MFPKWINSKVVAWSLYDFADTAFSALFITFFFPIFIKVHLGGNEFHIGLAMGISVIFAAVLVPVIGAATDTTGRRLPVLVGTAIATAIFTVLVGYSSLMLALCLGFAAHITHLVSKDVYDAKMIDIVEPRYFGALSGLGTAIGYMGTITSLGVAYLLLSHLGWESLQGIQGVFWVAGAFYVLFALPMVFMVPDKLRDTSIRSSAAVKQGIAEVVHTVKNLGEVPQFRRFLLASFLYNNAMNTAIIFLSLYGREVIGMTVQEFFPVFALMAFTAIFGSYIAGTLSDKVGPVPVIRSVLLIWVVVVVLLLIVAPSYNIFLWSGCIGGACLGAIWTLNRHMVTRLSSSENIGQFFGFEGLTEKFSGLIGPIIFGYLAAHYNYTAALISVLVFFALGFVALKRGD